MRHAFSLVELSIVIAVIGLITGGIIMGQNLIRSAELKSVAKELEIYRSAFTMFKDEYGELPGDLTNATEYWGMADACPGGPATGSETCNGNGNGRITQGANDSEFSEMFTAWQHLALSGFIDGSYTGIAGPSGVYHGNIGESLPASRLTDAGWTVVYMLEQIDNAGRFDGIYGNTLMIGKNSTSAATAYAAMTAKEAWKMDQKLDDGMPAQGMTVVRFRENCTNASNSAADSDNFDSVYNVQNTGLTCALIFREVF